MIDCFSINSELTDRLVREHSAFFVKTQFFKEGCMLTPEPFYETIVLWRKNTTYKALQQALYTIADVQNKIEPFGFMTDPIFEYNNGYPAFVWAIFIEDEKN